MNENRYPQVPAPLAATALLYVCGEMEPAEAGAFEARLALDQEVREALAEAVYLLMPMANGRIPNLNSSYRRRVRQRWGAQRRERSRGRFEPLFWGLTGAAAASIVWLVLVTGAGHVPVVTPQAAPTKAGGEQFPAPVEALFADMSNLDNLARHHQQYVQHKQKQDDFMNHHRANQTRPIPPGGGGAAL